MCGRVPLSSDISEIKLVFSIAPQRPTPNIAPSWNVAPTDPLPVVRYDARSGERSLDVMRWGLVPFWGKDLKVGFANINAMAEGIEDRPAFREAFQRRRCLVPVDNFYEWKKTGAGKQPDAIALADRRLMALAGLWETWRSSAGERMRSFAIMTTAPNKLCAELHNRMAVVLKPEGWPVWLGEEPADARQLKAMLFPYPAEEMTCWPVSTRVGNVKNNGRALSSRSQQMNLHRWFVAVFITLALGGCTQAATETGQAPYAPYSPDNNGEYPRDRGGDGGGWRRRRHVAGRASDHAEPPHEGAQRLPDRRQRLNLNPAVGLRDAGSMSPNFQP